MQSLRRRSDEVVRALVFVAWAVGIVSLLEPDDPPFSVLTGFAGELLLAAGFVAVSDGGHAISRLNERYGLRKEAPSHVVMGAGVIAIGSCWLLLGLYLTLN